MQLTSIQPRQNIIAIDNWQEYLRDGEQFLHTARRAHELGKKAFSPETLYNLTAMAIEKYIMAFLMHRGDLADNHTMNDLADALERHTGPLPELAPQLRQLDALQDICDAYQSSYAMIDSRQIEEIIAIGHQVQRTIQTLLEQEPASQ
ncbi:MAG: hypothetical protein ACK5PS_17245 [Desulfopila sp.]